jgi:hypothetical protein
MAICITIQVENITKVLTLYDQVKVYRSDTGIEGPYSEITNVSTRIALVSTAASYTYVDSTGFETSYYTVSYFNSLTSAESTQGPPTLGVSNQALGIMSVSTLKTNFLFGIDLTDDRGISYPDSLFQFYIESAVQYLQDKLDITLFPTVITDERHDYRRRDFENYMWVQADQIPIMSVEKVELVFPGNSKIIEFSGDSIMVDKDSGSIEVYPTLGAYTPAFYQGYNSFYGQHSYLPQFMRLHYTAGFSKVPADLIEMVGMLASMGPLGIAGDLLGGAGIASQSISIDGLSQSFNTTSSATNSGYGSRILQYQKALKDMWATIYRRYHPQNFMIVG